MLPQGVKETAILGLFVLVPFSCVTERRTQNRIKRCHPAASAASDPHTLQVVPGLIIGDATGPVGPTTNNVMASVAALGYYMAEKAAHF